MNIRSVLLLAVVVLGIVGGAMWFLLQSQPTLQPLPAPLELKAPRAAMPTGASTPSAPLAQRPAATPRAAVPEQSAPPKPPQAMADWEVKIDQVLQAKVDEAQTARMLINLLPTLPAEGQADAAQHISNLIEDKDYAQVLPLLRNTALPEEVQDVLVTDLLNRDDIVKLPALLEIAKMPNHPYHEEAQTDLQVFLDEDFGNDWPKWDAAMKKYLREQALEEAAAAATPDAPPTKQP